MPGIHHSLYSIDIGSTLPLDAMRVGMERDDSADGDGKRSTMGRPGTQSSPQAQI